MNRLKSRAFLTHESQTGFAAFAVTLILMVVLSLIVLGFAANSRDEQQRALDDQLSTAAYYAAESGINDAYAVIKGDLQNNLAIAPQTQCNNGPYVNSTGPTNSNNLTGNVTYTCLLVNPTPTSLQYTSEPTAEGQVVPLFAANNGPVTSINISWSATNGTGNFSGCPNSTQGTFPARASWSASCSAGVLQVDMVPASGWSSAQDLQNQATTVFLEPLANGNPSPQTVTAGEAGLFGGSCSASSSQVFGCFVNFNVPSASGYYLRIIPIYDEANYAVSADGQTPLTNAQAVIDSTGKARDELKRVEEHVSINPVGNNNSAPDEAIQSQSGICKMFSTFPGSTSGNSLNC